MRRKGFSRCGVALVVGAMALAGAAIAAAASVENGGFESGFDGWTTDSHGSGEWFTDEAGTLPAPPEGTHYAVTRQDGPSSNVLYQDVKLENHMKHKLSFSLAYHSAASFRTPHNLSEEGGDPTKRGGDNPNQQFRVDIMKPSAGLRSLKNSDVLQKVFRTNKGDATSKEWFEIHVNTDVDLAGRKVRLRFAEVDNRDVFTAGVDDVQIKSKAP